MTVVDRLVAVAGEVPDDVAVLLELAALPETVVLDARLEEVPLLLVVVAVESVLDAALLFVLVPLPPLAVAPALQPVKIRKDEMTTAPTCLKGGSP